MILNKDISANIQHNMSNLVLVSDTNLYTQTYFAVYYLNIMTHNK